MSSELHSSLGNTPLWGNDCDPLMCFNSGLGGAGCRCSSEVERLLGSTYKEG